MFTLIAGRVRPIRHRIEFENNVDVPLWAIVIGIVVIVAGLYCLYMASRAHKRPA